MNERFSAIDERQARMDQENTRAMLRAAGMRQ